MARSAVTESDVARAIDHEIGVWRENMKFVLQDTKLPKIGEDSFLKSCAWLSVAKDGVRSIAPKSELNQVITWLTSDAVKLAPPMFIASQAASAFDSIYSSTIREHNSLLNARYDNIKDYFFSKLDDQSRVFRSTDYGRKVIRDVMTYLRGQTLDDIDKASYLRLLLHRSKFIETDRDILKEHGVRGFSRICNTIYNLFRGSYRSRALFDNRKEMRVLTGGDWIGGGFGSGVMGVNYVRVTSREEQDKILAEAWRYSAKHYNSNAFFESKRADVTEVEHLREKPLRIPHTWTGPPLPLRDGDKAARAAFEKETGRTLN